MKFQDFIVILIINHRISWTRPQLCFQNSWSNITATNMQTSLARRFLYTLNTCRNSRCFLRNFSSNPEPDSASPVTENTSTSSDTNLDHEREEFLDLLRTSSFVNVGSKWNTGQIFPNRISIYSILLYRWVIPSIKLFEEKSFTLFMMTYT